MKTIASNNFSKFSESTPPFYSGKLVSFEDWKNSNFAYIDDSHSIIGDVDLRNVIGLASGAISEGEVIDWAELSENRCKRLQRNLDYLSLNPSYYLTPSPDANWAYIECNGQYFIGGQGKHRSVVLMHLAHHFPEQYLDGPIARAVTIYPARIDEEALLLNEFFTVLMAYLPNITVTTSYWRSTSTPHRSESKSHVMSYPPANSINSRRVMWQLKDNVTGNTVELDEAQVSRFVRNHSNRGWCPPDLARWAFKRQIKNLLEF